MKFPRRDPFTVRMPPGLRTRIRKSAQENRRSMNSEIVFHLDQVLPDEAPQKKGPVEAVTSPSHDHTQPLKGMSDEQS